MRLLTRAPSSRRIQAALELEKASSTFGYLDFLRTKANRYRLFMCIWIGVIVQWCVSCSAGPPRARRDRRTSRFLRAPARRHLSSSLIRFLNDVRRVGNGVYSYYLLPVLESIGIEGSAQQQGINGGYVSPFLL